MVSSSREIARGLSRQLGLFRGSRKILTAALALATSVAAANAGTLTIQTNIVGPTPKIIAYNLRHYYPGTNTRDWFRYSGISGARRFISPS